MTLPKLILILLASASVFLISSGRKPDPFDWANESPPGTFRLDEKVYVDMTEVTNFHWLEYEYWLKRTFGEESKEFTECALQESLWNKEDSCRHKYEDYYLRHPVYKDYPVVGVSYDQAVAYCKWRSDRVFEYLLIREDVLEWNVKQDKDNYFTTENYFAGKYNNKAAHPAVKMVPSYRLPTEEEWKRARMHADSVYKVEQERFRIRHRKAAKKPFVVCINSPPCIDSKHGPDIFAPVNENYVIRAGKHFDGNVSEWLFEKNLAIGSNWKDSVNSIFVRPYAGPDVTVGFRCVCEWKVAPKD